MNWKRSILTLALCFLALPAMGQLLKIHVEVWQGDPADKVSSQRIAGSTVVTKAGESATFASGQQVLKDESDLQHGTTLTAEVTEADGQCTYRCLLVVRELEENASTSPNDCLVFETQEYLIRGKMPLGGKKQYKLKGGRTLILSIEPQDPNAFKQKPEPIEQFRIIIGSPEADE